MIHPIENTPRAARSGRLGHAMTIAALAAALAACDRSQPVAPERAAPDAPSLTLNPACDPGLGGTTHLDSILAPETWSRANNPHRVYTSIHIEGAGVLTLQPGVLVCFEYAGALRAHNGGRLVADGLDTARIVLTATSPGFGWRGVRLSGSPASPSSLRNVRIEHTGGLEYALSTYDYHAAVIDSAVIRQNQLGLSLWGRGTNIRRSRVDTVTVFSYPAVELGTLITFEENVIRGAAGIGLSVVGTHGISLLGGRVEGSGSIGLWVTTTGPGFVDTRPVRVVGGASYPARMVVSAFPRIYPALSHQDSLLGNARDTLVVAGGILQAFAYPTQALPWHVTEIITVRYYGILRAWPGASLAFDPHARINAVDGGRVVARGTAAAPVLFTEANPGQGWSGMRFDGSPTLSSYLTNVRIEHVWYGPAVEAYASHPVVVDSAVFRQNGAAAWLQASNSRFSRSRVDTTFIDGPAVALSGDGTTMESTLIRGSAGDGLMVGWPIPQVQSCEIRDSAGHGILLYDATDVHNCNLVDNGGVGIRNLGAATADVENNWWGDAAGPTGTNGDGVSGALDYTPWRTTPYVLPYVP
ncbi:MAG TPA: right-handed parallel beta-helix repeat-containing protein [Longimicrobium sp.]|nr:right-handed parallel beta-helix repeat-containing protein [Longimicrobium sp.]